MKPGRSPFPGVLRSGAVRSSGVRGGPVTRIGGAWRRRFSALRCTNGTSRWARAWCRSPAGTMPVQYEGVIQEHRAVRTDAGAFDVSHMGEIEVEGPRALELLQGLLSNDLDRLERGRRAVHAAHERARRDHRRPDRLPARRLPLPARRQRVEPCGRLPLDQGARDQRLRRARRLRRVRADRGPGTERDREARPRRRRSSSRSPRNGSTVSRRW